jgi:hypothetical protein
MEVRNVMAHAQKPDFVFRQNGRVHLNRQGRQFSRLLASEVCASAVVMLYTPCSEVVWRVLATHSIRQFPLHLPPVRYRAITFQLDSTTARITISSGMRAVSQPPVRSGYETGIGPQSRPEYCRKDSDFLPQNVIPRTSNSWWSQCTNWAPQSYNDPKTPRVMWNRKYYYRVHTKKPMKFILSQTNPIYIPHASTIYLRSIWVIISHLRILTFICPNIASIFLKHNQQDATFPRSIYFYKLLYMFQAVPPPIIRSTKLCIQRQVLSNQ